MANNICIINKVWSSEIGNFVISKATELISAADFIDEFDKLVNDNLDEILSRTAIEDLNFGNERFRAIFNSIYHSDKIQVFYMLNELAFMKSAAARQLSQIGCSDSQMSGMFDLSNVDKTVIMFLR